MANAALNHTFTITIGDRWDDGHGKYRTVPFKCTHNSDEVAKLYGVASKLHGIDVTRYCNEYEDSSFPNEFVERLYEVFGPYPEIIKEMDRVLKDDDGNIDGEYVEEELYIELYFWTAKLVQGDLEWKKTESLPDLDIGGYGFFWG